MAICRCDLLGGRLLSYSSRATGSYISCGFQSMVKGGPQDTDGLSPRVMGNSRISTEPYRTENSSEALFCCGGGVDEPGVDDPRGSLLSVGSRIGPAGALCMEMLSRKDERRLSFRMWTDSHGPVPFEPFRLSSRVRTVITDRWRAPGRTGPFFFRISAVSLSSSLKSFGMFSCLVDTVMPLRGLAFSKLSAKFFRFATELRAFDLVRPAPSSSCPLIFSGAFSLVNTDSPAPASASSGLL
mmetsp:Transcript_48742/g.146882  ORF Transcript_48742/g.146882 Transcript_48742/m.146882 type:complete len:241 (+) Transcript_48742:541-1263(+)